MSKSFWKKCLVFRYPEVTLDFQKWLSLTDSTENLGENGWRSNAYAFGYSWIVFVFHIDRDCASSIQDKRAPTVDTVNQFVFFLCKISSGGNILVFCYPIAPPLISYPAVSLACFVFLAEMGKMKRVPLPLPGEN